MPFCFAADDDLADDLDDNEDFAMPQLGDPVLNLLQAGVVEEHVAVDMTVDMPAMGMYLKYYNFRHNFVIVYCILQLTFNNFQILKKVR